MFKCETNITCDVCGIGYRSTGKRMSDCISRDNWRYYKAKEGWKVIYGKYDVCRKCIERYGIKEIRRNFKQKECE